MNNGEDLNQKKNENNLLKIISTYTIRHIFNFLERRILLNIIKENKKIQEILDISLKDYKSYSEIEIDIIPDNYRDMEKGRIITFYNLDEAKYFHIYYNDNNKEITSENKNIILRKEMKIWKIKVIIDANVKSFNKLFYCCSDIKSITFVKFNRSNIKICFLDAHL